MACSRCAERRRALASGIASLSKGDTTSAAEAAAFVARTSAQDIKAAARRSALALARLSLKRR